MTELSGRGGASCSRDVGAASPRLLELTNREGEITFDGLSDDDNALDHRFAPHSRVGTEGVTRSTCA